MKFEVLALRWDNLAGFFDSEAGGIEGESERSGRMQKAKVT